MYYLYCIYYTGIYYIQIKYYIKTLRVIIFINTTGVKKNRILITKLKQWF